MTMNFPTISYLSQESQEYPDATSVVLPKGPPLRGMCSTHLIDQRRAQARDLLVQSPDAEKRQTRVAMF